MNGFGFDVDCGEVFPGHRLALTGLRVDGVSDDAIHADYSQHFPGKPAYPMVAMTYVITPALPDDTFNGHDVDATVRLEPQPDPTYWDMIVTPGGERDITPGATETLGAFGPFALPAGTRRIKITLSESQVLASVADPWPPPENVAHRIGEVVIELGEQAVTWLPG